MTCPRRRCWWTSQWTASRSRRWRCPPSRHASISSTASPASRSGRCVEKPAPQGRCARREGTRRPSPCRPSLRLMRAGVTTDDADRLHARVAPEGAGDGQGYYKMGPMYTPAVVGKSGRTHRHPGLGPANGGTNWPGGCFNPETHVCVLAWQFRPVGVSVWCRRRPACPTWIMSKACGPAGRESMPAGAGSGADAPKVSARPGRRRPRRIRRPRRAAAARGRIAFGQAALRHRSLPINLDTGTIALAGRPWRDARLYPQQSGAQGPHHPATGQTG